MATTMEFGLIGHPVTMGLPPVPALQLRIPGVVPETDEFEILSHPAGKVRCTKSHASCAEEGRPPEELLQLFVDPTQWWDNRRSKLATVNPDCRHENSVVALWMNNERKPVWVDSQPAISNGEMKKPSESVSTAFQGQGAFGTDAAGEEQLEVKMCRKLCEDGLITDGVDALDLLVQRGCRVDRHLFYRALKRCKDLVLGRRIHALSGKGGYEGDAFLATHLIGLYASHRRLKDAMQVFNKVSTPDAYNWAAIILAYARHGEAAEAIRLYQHMRDSTTVQPTDCVYVAVLKACASAGDLVTGKEVHAHILESPWNPNIFVKNGLVNMYAKCGSLEDARRVFDRLSERNVVTWNALFAGYSQQGMGQEALDLYSEMQQEGLPPPDSVTYVCLMQACASVGVGALHHGKQLHAEIQERGLQHDMVLGSSLVNMYAKCGSLVDARIVFDKLPHKDVVTWTAMIAGYAQKGMGQEGLILYSSMPQECLIPPNPVLYVSLLQACASTGVGALHHGKQLHAQIEAEGLQDNVVVGSSLVNMYAKCSSLGDARRMFDRFPTRNVVTWTTMIAAYAQQGMGLEALSLYRSMQQEGLSPPDSVTYACLLQACASVGVGAANHGKEIHAEIRERGLHVDIALGSCLVNMYAKCGSLKDARSLFDTLRDKDVVTWTAMIAGYAQQGMGQEALRLYSSMQQEGLVLPNSVSYVSLLQACAIVGVGAFHQGKHLHAQIEYCGLQGDVVLGSCLVNMYAKCSSLKDARKMFDQLPNRDVVTWTVMIAGYAQQGLGEEALQLYNSMQQESLVPPNSVSYLCLLRACAVVAALPLGKQLHSQIKKQGLQADPIVGAALVNMYAKCGSMVDSQQAFDSLPERTIEAWGALTAGYTRQGDTEVVFNLLETMRLEGLRPNGIVFLCVLTVCSHAGLVDEGREYFEVMSTDYGISPTIEHYICMMDLLGRAGHLDKALQIAKTMPFSPNSTVWHMLLGACRKWNNVEIGQQAFESAISLNEEDAAAYVLMFNIYASARMWEAAKEMQARRVRSGARKEQGQSWWTDMSGVVHKFVVGDRKQHPENEDFYGRPELTRGGVGSRPSLLIAGHIS